MGLAALSLGSRPAVLGAQEPARLELTFHPYTLALQHTFTLAGSSRTTTPVMLTEVRYGDLVGYGEASMPPYLGESHATAAAFLSRVDLSRYTNPFELETILADLDALAPGNPAAKAAVDIALHDLLGKLMGQPWYNVWGLNPAQGPPTSFTIGIDTPEAVRQKTREARGFKLLKVKLGRGTDREMIEAVRSVSDLPLSVDVNQGWQDRAAALDFIPWLKERGVILVEQPLAKERRDDLAWLSERSPLPIIGDEGVQRLADVRPAYGVYSGINIKLMKCAGLREAYKMATLARGLGLKIMLGCMTETWCAISAASQLAALADWADLDGALLIGNDPFDGARLRDGKIVPADWPGIGVRKRS